jgi:hypothetical protein
MPTPSPIAEPLDAFLNQVIQTIHEAADQGMRHVHDDPETTDRVIQDCQEILGQIMQGNVKSWIDP